ncbi:MAG: hypothetical protein ACTSSA_12620 [Candidatus Freyarchaeota archaeon]
MEISIPTDKGVLRFFFENLGPEAEVRAILDMNEGNLDLGNIKFKELKHATKAIAGL